MSDKVKVTVTFSDVDGDEARQIVKDALAEYVQARLPLGLYLNKRYAFDPNEGVPGARRHLALLKEKIERVTRRVEAASDVEIGVEEVNEP